MDFNVTSSCKAASGGLASPLGNVGQAIPTTTSRLSMYQAAPQGEVSLEEFEQFALDRLQVLKGLEEARARGKKAEELDDLVADLWRKHMRQPAGGADAAARKDVLSHFVLRLAYCRTWGPLRPPPSSFCCLPLCSIVLLPPPTLLPHNFPPLHTPLPPPPSAPTLPTSQPGLQTRRPSSANAAAAVRCLREEHRRWLLAQEATLFRHRFRREVPDAQRRLLEEARLPYKAVPPAELEASVGTSRSMRPRRLDDLLTLTSIEPAILSPPSLLPPLSSLPSPSLLPPSARFQLPGGSREARSGGTLDGHLPPRWSPLRTSPSSRRVLLVRGAAFVPRDQLAVVVVGHFRARLSHALVLTS
eukprot:SM001063S14115  [mRNA]  locus=s1063:253:2105:+ [translate_table: standard]